MTLHPSRRQFMKRLTLGSASLAVAPTLVSAQGRSLDRPKIPQDQKLGIALVGLGYYSTQLLAPALQETEYVRLAGIVTGTPAKAEDWKAKYGIPEGNVYNYETFEQIADNSEIDIIYIVLPNSMHAEYVIRAASTGKHVICEKPMAVSVEECQAMIDACNEAGVKLAIGYRMQHEPYTQEIMRLGQEQEFGPIRMVTTGAGYRESRADHWKLDKSMGGGAMYDMGVYSLQGARYVTGEEPVTVSAQTFTTRPELFTEVDETTTFQLEFPSGAVANCHTSFGFGMNYLQANAERGWIRLRPFQAYRGIQGRTSNGPLDFPDINQQARQMDDTALAIMQDEPVLVPGEEGLRDIRVVEGIYQSIANGGETITLPPLD